MSFLDPESSFREDLQSELKGGGTPTFLEAPGPKLACGVPTFLSCWGHRVERLVGLMGTSGAAVGAVLQRPRCSVHVSAPCLRRSQAVLQSSHLEESPCRGGPGRFLWICSGPPLDQGSENDSYCHETFGREKKDTFKKFICHSYCTSTCPEKTA